MHLLEQQAYIDSRTDMQEPTSLQVAKPIGLKRPLPNLLTRYGKKIQKELLSLIPEGDSEIYSTLRYHLGWADQAGNTLKSPQGLGKSLRPSLCLFACQALGGNWLQALPAAASIELIHNFSLIHDDIEDGDTERRHRPTMWSLWGLPKALVAGNTMHSLAYKTTLNLTEKGVTLEKALTCSLLLVESSLAMIKGQCLDLVYEEIHNTPIETYMEMIRLKTGALITCSVEIGAILGCSNQAYVRAFISSAAHLGRAFQIQDDILGIWGKPKETGKASGNDIWRKKKSFPIVYALQNLTGPTRKHLIETYQKESLDRADIKKVLDILADSGAQDQAKKLVEKEAHLAFSELKEVPLPVWAREEIKELTEFLAYREY